jgi:ketosteroid isomerase-like protein
MQKILCGLLTLSVVAPSFAQPEEATIRARDQALGRAIASADQRGVHDLLSTDVRLVRREGLTFGVQTAKLRLPSLFGLAPGLEFSRSLETLRVSSSGDLAVAIATHSLVSSTAGSTTEQHLSIWRRNPEAEWRLAADGPIEAWQSLDSRIVLRESPHAPGRHVVEFAPSDLVAQIETGSFWPSRAGDLAYSLGEFYVRPEPNASTKPRLYGYFLVAWEQANGRWHPIAVSLPEPVGPYTP